MTLQERLAKIRGKFEQGAPEDVKAVMHRATEDLRASGILEGVIKAGAELPPFRLYDTHGDPVDSKELLARGPMVLTFYRGHWCPYCNVELAALQKLHGAFQAAGASLVAVSPQRAEQNKLVAEKHSIGFPVLSDPKNAYAAALGLVFTLPEDLRAVYRGFGIDLLADNGDDSWTLPLPARIIVESSGIIRSIDADPDYTIRVEPEASLTAVRALQASGA